jgi:hypothetical protein
VNESETVYRASFTNATYHFVIIRPDGGEHCWCDMSKAE